MESKKYNKQTVSDDAIGMLSGQDIKFIKRDSLSNSIVSYNQVSSRNHNKTEQVTLKPSDTNKVNLTVNTFKIRADDEESMDTNDNNTTKLISKL